MSFAGILHNSTPQNLKEIVTSVRNTTHKWNIVNTYKHLSTDGDIMLIGVCQYIASFDLVADTILLAAQAQSKIKILEKVSCALEKRFDRS